jgi:CHAT domain-containing protein
VTLRSAALLLVTLACTGAQQQSSAKEMYQEARAAIEHGDYLRARSIAAQGVRVSATGAGYRDLFVIAQAEAMAREDAMGAIALLDRTPPSDHPEARVRRLMARGYALQVQGKYDKSAAAYEKADRLAAELMPSLRAEIAMLRITPPFHQQKWDTAEGFAREAIALAKPRRQLYVLANAYCMLGAVEMNRRQWESALQHLTEATRLARVTQADSTLYGTIGNIGWSSQQLGDLDDAQARFMEVENYAERQNVLRTQPTWLANIAGVYIVRGQYRQAFVYAERAVEVARKIKNESKLATALSNLAQVHVELRDYAAARRVNDEALAKSREMRVKASELAAMINAARIEDGTGAPDRASNTLDSVIAAAGDDPPIRWQAQAFAGEINRRLGRTASAEQMYEAALATGDSAWPKINQVDTYVFTFESNLIRFYDRYIDLLLADDRVDDALRIAERSRARALREGLELKVDPHLAPMALARANDATILWFWLAPERSLLWVIAPDGIAVERLPPQAQIEKRIDQYRRETLARSSGIDSESAVALYHMLVAPALVHTRARRFVIIPDGRLNDINLEAVVIPTPRPHFWIEDATISYAPCLQFLVGSGRQRPFRDARLLVVGNVPAQEGFPALARAGTEMKNVSRHFDSRQQVLLTGLGATRTAFLGTDLQDISFIHLATHSTASVAAPLESSVILTGDRRLTGHDIAAKKLHAELVTISSCSSAGRRSYAGEGVVGLAWAFLRAGAKRVVASQWDVSDTATAMLMDTMYDELANGRDPASALRTAKLVLLHSNSIYERQFYWSPFILYGAP